MLFVDGENLSKRGLEALSSRGIDPTPGDFWQKDVYLWQPGVPARAPFFSIYQGDGPKRADQAVRAYYYTSTTSDEPGWTDTRLRLRKAGFEPRLFKRTQGRSKAVDLGLATDLLTLGGENRYDIAVLFAGDGDYLPLLQAVKRLGHHVIVGFFPEHGLNQELQIAADAFIDLTEFFVTAWDRHLHPRKDGY